MKESHCCMLICTTPSEKSNPKGKRTQIRGLINSNLRCRFQGGSPTLGAALLYAHLHHTLSFTHYPLARQFKLQGATMVVASGYPTSKRWGCQERPKSKGFKGMKKTMFFWGAKYLPGDLGTKTSVEEEGKWGG
ncbi:hypothetical protein L1887_38766 [Cichorium endivia]|nr:hypothetical protein L1887_38766 [Cichorium endivia]